MPTVTIRDKQTGTEININYEVIGGGEEVLVLHHGNGNCIQDWHSLGFVDALKDDFKLVLIDSRGYGKSSKPHDAEEYNLKSRAEDTIAVLDQENIKSAHCLGASVGASVCFLLAKYFPERFKSYIFATPYFTLFDESVKKALAKGTETYVAELEEQLGSKISNEAIRQTFLANDARALLAANSSEWFNYKEYSQYITKPALIYVGDQEPTLPELRELATTLQQSSQHDCNLHIFPNANHADVYWGGREAAPIIRSFIQEQTCTPAIKSKL